MHQLLYLLAAAQPQKKAFRHGLRDGILFIPHGITNIFGAHHTLYNHHAKGLYDLGFILALGTMVLVIAWIIALIRR